MAEKVEPGQKGVRRFLTTLSSVVSQGEIFQSSIVIAYYILFSIFPIVIIVGNALPWFHHGPVVHVLYGERGQNRDEPPLWRPQ